MADHCPEHTQMIIDVAEIKKDVKYLVETQKHQICKFEHHIEEGVGYRDKISRNSFHVKILWSAFTLSIATIITMVIRDIWAKQ